MPSWEVFTIWRGLPVTLYQNLGQHVERTLRSIFHLFLPLSNYCALPFIFSDAAQKEGRGRGEARADRASWHEPAVRHRRSAQRGEVHLLQRAHQDADSCRRKLPILHHRSK